MNTSRRIPHVRDVAIAGDYVVLGGYPAWYLHQALLAYPGGLASLLARSRVPLDKREDVTRATDALGVVGATWRMQHDLASTSGSPDESDAAGDLSSKHGSRGGPLGSSEAASALGLSSRRVRMLAESGQLRGHQDSGGRWQFEPADVEAELERRRAMTGMGDAAAA